MAEPGLEPCSLVPKLVYLATLLYHFSVVAETDFVPKLPTGL